MSTVTEAWEANATTHADDRLANIRGSWWFTGKHPDLGECPGVEANGKITSLQMPDLSTCDREAVLDYFDNSWTLTEILFAGLQTAEAFYRPPGHNLRHPLIFYYGHPAVLYVNKLRVSGLVNPPVNPYFEQILETGVDEMSWDDLSKNEMSWPSVAEVRDYRAEVYQLVRSVIENTDFASDLGRPITMDDPAWAIFMGFEHERIHLETSSVLIRELPLRLVSAHPAWPAPAPDRRTAENNQPTADVVPENQMVTVAGGTTVLGKPKSFPSYGWDNEYGTREIDVAEFEAARYLVSNGEYHRFVSDGGYRRPELWTEEGWDWRAFRNAKWPQFWVPDGPSGLHRYRLRTISEEIDMPWDWPVCVNFHEARAYCTWRGEQDGRTYRMPTEAEFRRMRALPDEPTVADDPVLDSSGADLRARDVNLNLAWGSECPVDTSPATVDGVHDSAGNLWVWCEDVANPFDGFEVHPYYEDFTAPCFDGLHQMILGGCFISTGDEASIWARYHFRAHFLQQSGIRLISTSVQPGQMVKDPYLTVGMRDRYLLMHFANIEETFGAADHDLVRAHGYTQRLMGVLTRTAEQIRVPVDRVMDVGCAVGGGTFALAAGAARDVVGVDLSPLLIDTATMLARGESIDYVRVDQGEVGTTLTARAPVPNDGTKIEFVVGDALDLPDSLGVFDAVVLADLLDCVDGPEACLRQFADSDRFLRSGGLLLVASPWSWNPAQANRQKWLGGRTGSPSSEQEVRRILSDAFELVAQSNEPGVLRDHGRHYEYLNADVTVWRKK